MKPKSGGWIIYKVGIAYFIVGIFNFFKRLQKEQKPDVKEGVNNHHQSSPIVTNSHQQPETTRNQQDERESYNKRDLQYARRIGQLEEMSEDVSDIKDKLTALDVKFDMRVPERVLTESKFEDAVLESKDIFKEIESIKNSLNELEETITNNQQLSTVRNIRESAENIELDLREAEIKRILGKERLGTKELGKRLGLSRSRTNQILLEMESEGNVSRVKYGKKYLWKVT